MMDRRSKWPNEEMWMQAVEWRKGGRTYGQIEALLSRDEYRKQFGLSESPSQDTIRRQVDLRLKRAEGPFHSASRLTGPEMKAHYDAMVKPLLGLLEVLPLPIHDRDIGTWFIRPDEENWPVAKGRAYREGDSVIDVRLNAEAASKPQFEYLGQHLERDPIWEAIENWKRAMSKDLSSRFALLRRVVGYIESPEKGGGLGLPVVDEPSRTTQTGPVAGVFLAFTVYDQILTEVMKLKHGFYQRDRIESIRPNLTAVVGYTLVRSDVDSDHERAVEFLFEGWKGMDWRPQVDSLAETYREAEQRCDILVRNVKRLELTPGFPVGSVCDLCGQ